MPDLPHNCRTEDLSPVVLEARKGRSSAWDCLFKRYQLPLYSYVQELIRNESEALDIVQETFIAALRHLSGLRDDNRFGSWLFGIAHQRVVQRWRKSGREVALDDEAHAAVSRDEAPDPGEELLRSEQGAILLSLVEELPPRQRAVVVLHLIEDFSLEEISGITGVPQGTVKSRLHHARLTLRKRIEEMQLRSPGSLDIVPRPQTT